MCGIAGIVSEKPVSPRSMNLVRRLQSALVHRGPDDSGEFQSQHAAFGVRRLSIIDLVGGVQPLYNEDRSVALVANGEIYNYLELQDHLRARGHGLRTKSDCETIVHLYEEYGPACVDHLRGMFAFALWDSTRRRLLLARDRIGEKPLYMYEGSGELVFASELKALLSSGVVYPELDPVAVDLYFHYQYVPEPMTIIRGVRKLRAGHLLLINVNPWRATEACYWRMEDAPPIEGEPVEVVRSELERVSELVVRADVPVGIALSGGLDSSAIAALTSRRYPGTMHAFSVGYPGHPPCDEREDAKALADYLGMPFHEVEVSTSEMVESFPEVVYWRDDPIADISGQGYFAVMKAARQEKVPVVLQGQGGDELFWGYPWVVEALRQTLRKERLRREGSASVLDYIEWRRLACSHSAGEWLARIREFWHSYRRDRTVPLDQLVFYEMAPDFEKARGEMMGLYVPAFAEQLDGTSVAAPYTVPRPWLPLDVLITRLITQTYLLENGIAQGDRLAMASSVELRLPLLDYKLVETVIGLRKVRPDYHLPPKAWLRAALRDVLPDQFINRPKRGFAPPVREWYRALFATYGSMLGDGHLVQMGVLRPGAAENLAKGPIPPGSVSPISFKALVLETWCRRLLSAAPA